jgi:diguanylate cyclase (GGDEF)-like protein
VLQREVVDSAWTAFDGRRGFVLRKPIVDSDWSLLIAIPISGVFASRFLGIIITLQFAITALFYFFGREHGIRDSIQLEKRLELQNEAEGLKIRATTDRLTGLFNRAKFDEQLLSEIARAQRYTTPFSLVLYDIDHFKEVNDAYGHQMGDHVLVGLSEIVARGLREVDFLARWGGEEFVVLLPGCSREMAGLAAEKLRAAIASTTFDPVGSITSSFGVAEFNDGDTAESLMARADNALYRAKMNGRDRVELDLPVVEPTELSPVDDPRLIRKGASSV